MIYMFLANGFEETEALTPLDLIRRAGIEIKTVGVGGTEITGAHGIRVSADIADTVFDSSDMTGIILPGGMPGTKNLDASPVVDKALRCAFDGGLLICAICAAPMIPGKRGMLSGKKAVCFPGFEQYLIGAEHTSGRVEHDGRFITAVGMGAALEFGLEIVSAVKGEYEAGALAAAVLAPSFVKGN
ncbi:MAG: DJ-1/PfpI family protein [Clostridia bacterium]|nr:DJ-1/PfpI family protein [Clostridia bacterium]